MIERHEKLRNRLQQNQRRTKNDFSKRLAIWKLSQTVIKTDFDSEKFGLRLMLFKKVFDAASFDCQRQKVIFAKNENYFSSIGTKTHHKKKNCEKGFSIEDVFTCLMCWDFVDKPSSVFWNFSLNFSSTSIKFQVKTRCLSFVTPDVCCVRGFLSITEHLHKQDYQKSFQKAADIFNEQTKR